MGESVPLEPQKILVVEDDWLVGLALSTYLSDAGFEVIDVSNADEAIEVLTVSPEIRVLVTDVEMAGSMDGIALARLVRDRWPLVHIIVVSGYRRSSELRLPERSLFFPKPYEFPRLLGAVQEFVKYGGAFV